MKTFQQRVRAVAHGGLRAFVRLRMPVAIGFVVTFGVYEACRHYQTNLLGLPTAIRQDASDEWDDFNGVSDLQRAPEDLKRKADGGHAFAQFVYGLRRTDRLPKEYRIAPADIQIARDYFERAAQGGLTRAKAVQASYMQRDLLSNPQATVDRKLMERYAREAADNQDSLGRRVLADILFEQAKTVHPPDRELEQQAYRLLLNSAERGTRSAIRKVGELYLEGRHGFTDEAGEPILVQNFTQGIACFEQAALARDFEACCRLAEIYTEKRHAPVDLIKGYAWSLVAIQLAPRDEEPGLKLDPAQSKRLLDEAAKKDAVALRLKTLAVQLSPAELTAAQDLARALLVRIPTEKEYAERVVLKAR